MTFDEFVSTRLRALVRYATVLTCDVHLAEDITQEVLVRAQARWSKIARLAVPEQYVKRMVVNEFLSWRRRRAARVVPLSTESLDRLMPPAVDPADQPDDDAVLRLVASLPPRQRAAVALRFYEDLADEQIADLLGCRTVTVRSHISRALATLRTSLPARPVTNGWR